MKYQSFGSKHRQDIQAGHGIHWSIFIKQVGRGWGFKHDAMYEFVPGRGWMWKYSAMEEHNEQQSQRFGGKVIVAYITNLAGFQRIVRETPLPTLRQNCRNWVYGVFQEAIRQGLIPQAALLRLLALPTVGTGV